MLVLWLHITNMNMLTSKCDIHYNWRSILNFLTYFDLEIWPSMLKIKYDYRYTKCIPLDHKIGIINTINWIILLLILIKKSKIQEWTLVNITNFHKWRPFCFWFAELHSSKNYEEKYRICYFFMKFKFKIHNMRDIWTENLSKFGIFQIWWAKHNITQ